MVTTVYGALLFNTFLFSLLLGAQTSIRACMHGLGFALSSLDKAVETSVLENRLKRVTANQLEFLVLAGLTLVAAVQWDVAIDNEAWIALSFVAGRVLYIPMVVIGVPILRSGTWLIGFFGWIYLFVQITMEI